MKSEKQDALMLTVDHITVEYDGRPVVEDFSLEMQPGEIVSLVGESGSGKTTVIRAILGLLPEGGEVSKGDILFEGTSLLRRSEAELDAIRGRDITMIFQDSGAMIDPTATIGSQFIEYIRAHERVSRDEAYKKAAAMLGATRLPDPDNVMHSYPFQLSGGMRQRVGIAMGMVFHPKLLLADEPTSALDVTTQAQIIRQMMEMYKASKTSIIIVTHNLGVAAYMSDRILVMRYGKVVEQGDREAVLHHPQSDYTRELLDAIPTMDGEIYV